MVDFKLIKSLDDFPKIGMFVTLTFLPIKGGKRLTDIKDEIHGELLEINSKTENENGTFVYSVTINHISNINDYLNNGKLNVQTKITIPMSNKVQISGRVKIPSVG